MAVRSWWKGLCVLGSTMAHAVPTSFLLEPAGNQRDIQWMRRENDHFSVYYDPKSGALAQTALDGLNHAYPYLRQLLGVKVGNDSTPGFAASRFQKVPLILGTRDPKGGFANPISQNIEVQVDMGSDAALFQHELVHRLMYEHTDLHVGPLGRLGALAIVPTWWIEGLPEYLTESIGRLDTAGIARTLALSGAWPTWDRLHSLYTVDSGDTFLKGYVTSGRLFRHLVDLSQTTHLATLHKTLFQSILTPPFAGAAERVVRKLTQLSGRELYTSMQKAEKTFWQKHVGDMPSLLSRATPIVDSHAPFNIGFLEGTLRASAFGPGPFPGGLWSFAAVHRPTVHRQPVPWAGSRLLAQAGPRVLYTTERRELPNHSRGWDVVRVSLKEPLGPPGAPVPGVLSREVIVLPTPGDPAVVAQVAPQGGPGKGGAYVAGVTHGNWVLWRVQGSGAYVVKTYPSPASIELLPRGTDSPCALVLVGGASGSSYVEDVCPTGPSRAVVPPGHFTIRGGFEGATGALTLLVGWRDLLGLVRWEGPGRATPLASFPEWVVGLWPGSREGTAFTFVYTGQGTRPYRLVEVDLSALSSAHGAWVARNPQWALPPSWAPEIPPYVALAKRLSGNTSPGGTGAGSLREERATYRHRHWFTYPYFVPDFYGLAHQVGVFSIPWVDEMERHMVTASALYNTSTGGLGGTLTYTNNRVADHFQVALFSHDRWNGLFYVTPQPTGGLYGALAEPPTGDKTPYPFGHSLKETGTSLGMSWRWGAPTKSFTGGVSLGLSRLSPGQKNRMGNVRGLWEPAFGAQRLFLGKGLFALGAPLWYAPWLRSPPRGAIPPPGQMPEDTYGLWVGRLSLEQSYSTNVGPARTGQGRRVENGVGFFQTAARLSQSLQWGTHQVSAVSQVATTQREGPGRGPLHSLETYSPLGVSLGTTEGFTESLSLYLGDDAKSWPVMGPWSYQNSLEYSRPLWEEADVYLGLPYLDSLVGLASITRGGVSRRGPWHRTHSTTTLKVGVKAILDVKGVPLYPAASVVKLWGSRRWFFHLALGTAPFL